MRCTSASDPTTRTCASSNSRRNAKCAGCAPARHIARLGRKDEWVGTRLVFQITPAGEGRTQLDFEHVGLVSAFECYDLCSNGWHYFLDSLQQFVETGRGTPYEVAATPGCVELDAMRSQAA